MQANVDFATNIAKCKNNEMKNKSKAKDKKEKNE